MTDYYFDVETTGLNPFENKLLTVQLKRGNDIVIWKLWEEENELDLIEKLLDRLGNISKSNSIYGYNCLKFDVPFVASRLTLNGALDGRSYTALYDRNWVDLYQFLGGSYVSMDRWLSFYGIKRDCPFRGSHVPSLFAEKRFVEIEEHAAEDVVLCEKLVEKLRSDHSAWRASASTLALAEEMS